MFHTSQETVERVKLTEVFSIVNQDLDVYHFQGKWWHLNTETLREKTKKNLLGFCLLFCTEKKSFITDVYTPEATQLSNNKVHLWAVK